MPMYEYRCKRCNHKFERLVSYENRETPGDCPECGCARSKRLMSSFAGHTSGGGNIGGSSCGGCSKSSCAGCHH